MSLMGLIAGHVGGASTTVHVVVVSWAQATGIEGFHNRWHQAGATTATGMVTIAIRIAVLSDTSCWCGGS